MGGGKGGKSGKAGKGGKGKTNSKNDPLIWTGSGGYGNSGAGGPCRLQEVDEIISGQAVSPDVLGQRLRSLNVNKLPGSGGQQGVRSWGETSRGWNFLCAAILGQPSQDETENVSCQLFRATGSDWFATTDPWQVERELQRSNKFAQYLFLSLHPELPAQRQQQTFSSSADDLPKVLMIAEKPKLVEAIAGSLSNNRMRWRKGIAKAMPIYEFITYFPPAGTKCKLIMTCTKGHIFGLDIDPADNRAAGNDPSKLYDAKAVKVVEESVAKLRIVENLQELATECEYLVLWLDCDREGENIGFEVIGVCRESFPTDENIYRAQFSALTDQEMKRALNNLVRPNKFLSMAVDARQELDLKIGFSFSRLIRRNFLDMAKQKFPRDPPTTLSYGPCQIPTLWFCVSRHQEIKSFQRQNYWAPKLHLNIQGSRCEFAFVQGNIFDPQQAKYVELVCRQAGAAIVVDVFSEQKTVRRPPGLNTVQLLKAASSGMGMSPVTCMRAAEDLYTQGYISYPRTESSRYPETFDVAAALQEQSYHPNWGKTAAYILQNNPNIRVPKQGHDAGDHPPITPVRCAPRGEIAKGKEWKLYDYIARHFIASLMDDVQYTEHTARVHLGDPNNQFEFKWHTVDERGFWFAMPWKQNDHKLNELQRPPRIQSGVQLQVVGVEIDQDYTKPPDYLKESELVELMDKHGIGTDASIPQHVQNIIDRKYAIVCGPGEDGKSGNRILSEQEIYQKKWGKRGDPNFQPERPASRHMVPTGLGCAMIGGFEKIDRELCEPAVRAFMERQVGMIADGSESLQDVLTQNLQLFHTKFLAFRDNMAPLEQMLRPKTMDGGSYRDYGAHAWQGQGWTGWG